MTRSVVKPARQSITYERVNGRDMDSRVYLMARRFGEAGEDITVASRILIKHRCKAMRIFVGSAAPCSSPPSKDTGNQSKPMYSKSAKAGGWGGRRARGCVVPEGGAAWPWFGKKGGIYKARENSLRKRDKSCHNLRLR